MRPNLIIHLVNQQFLVYNGGTGGKIRIYKTTKGLKAYLELAIGKNKALIKLRGFGMSPLLLEVKDIAEPFSDHGIVVEYD